MRSLLEIVVTILVGVAAGVIVVAVCRALGVTGFGAGLWSGIALASATNTFLNYLRRPENKER